MKHLIVFPLTIMLLSSCSKEKTVQPNCDLYVRYEADAQKIMAEANIFDANENGKKMQLSPSGGVAFMGSNMEKRELPGGKVRYFFEHKNNLPSSLSLSWNNPNSKKSKLGFAPIKCENFQFVAENENFKLIIDGQPLTSEESLVFLFTDGNNKMLNQEIKGPSNSTSFDIPKSNLEELSPGHGQLSVVRTKHFSQAGDDCECNVTFSYYSNPIEVDW